MLSQNQSESPVFRYHGRYPGRDPFEEIMRYTCTNCKATLLVDPMDMLTSFCVRGVPEIINPKSEKKPKTHTLIQTGKILQKIPRKTAVLKYH